MYPPYDYYISYTKAIRNEARHYYKVLFLAAVTTNAHQELYSRYSVSSIELSGSETCPCTQKLWEKIKRDIDLYLNNNVFRGHGTCGGGGLGWRRSAYLNMSDPTQTCSPAWELITTSRRSCARPFNAGSYSCYSAMFLFKVFNTLRSVEQS